MEICDEVGWLSYERKRTERKQGHPLWLLANYLEVRNVVCCLWIFQELLQQSLSWPKMFAHSWSGLQVRDSFFFPISGKLRAFAIYQKTSETSMESAIGWRTCAILHSFLSLSLFKIQDGRTDIALNCLDLANPSEKLKVELVFPLEKFPTGELDKEPDKERENRTKIRHEIGQKNQTRNQTKNWANNQTRNREKTRTRNRTKKPTEIQPKKSRTKKKWTKSGQKRVLSNTPLFSWTHNELTPRLTSDIFRKNVIFPKLDQYSFIEPDHDDRKRMGMKVNIVY